MSALNQDKAAAASMGETIGRIVNHPFEVFEVVMEDHPDNEGADRVERLKCPWCMALVNIDDNDALARVMVTVSLQSSYYWPEEHGQVVHTEDETFWASDGHTLYYIHRVCGNPVRLPEGWTGDFD